MRINSVPDVKSFCNNKNVLRAQSMVWHFVRHPVHQGWTEVKSNSLPGPLNTDETQLIKDLFQINNLMHNFFIL